MKGADLEDCHIFFSCDGPASALETGVGAWFGYGKLIPGCVG